MAQYWQTYSTVDDVSPTFEKAYEWLLANRPPRTATTIVHGDLRMGNVIVDDGRPRGGDRLGARARRRSARGPRVALREGVALRCAARGRRPRHDRRTRRGLRAAGGRPVDRDALHWWLVQKTLQWGIGCMGQASVHLTGTVRSDELAAIGRRVAEQEWDLIELLAPDAVGRRPRRTAPAARCPTSPGCYGRPTARELLDAVRGFLTDDVMPATIGPALVPRAGRGQHARDRRTRAGPGAKRLRTATTGPSLARRRTRQARRRQPEALEDVVGASASPDQRLR